MINRKQENLYVALKKTYTLDAQKNAVKKTCLKKT